MEFLIRAALIIDSQSPHHLSKKDILVENGTIAKIDDNIDFEGKTISADGLRVSPGWVDMRAHFNDPGLEHKEDLESGSLAAAAGGFTDVVLLPNNQPAVTTKNAISYYQKWNRNSAVTLHAAAAVTKDCKGEELTEMIDLHEAGAVAFTDGINPLWHTDILLKSLQYLQKFDGLLINRPEDAMLTAFGNMNEGTVSTMLGMKGMPSLAEEVMVKRDIQILEYTGGKLHFSLISSKGAIELIREAKASGLNVTADTSTNYLVYTEEDLTDYDTNYKVNPPLRTNDDKEALISAVKDGTIDVLVSDHQPQDEESKKLEFDLADFGMIGLQTHYPQLLKAFGEGADEIIDATNRRAREILGFDNVSLKEGETAKLTMYSPEISWQFDGTSNHSKSENSPCFGQEWKGQVLGIFNNRELVEH